MQQVFFNEYLDDTVHQPHAWHVNILDISPLHDRNIDLAGGDNYIGPILVDTQHVNAILQGK